MFLYFILVFVVQLCYCSASCECSCGTVLPTHAAYLIGITITVLFVTTLALAVIVYRLKRVKSSDGHSLFENTRHASITKYEQQTSENSQRKTLKNSMDDDTVLLTRNENMCDDHDIDRDSTDANEVKIETETKTIETPNRIRKQPKVPVFPQMQEEQMNEIIKAVLSKNRKKECTTSLSDLDKIVNDAKEEAKETKILDVSASTPELDIHDEPSPIPKLPVYEADSKESKLRDEMKAMFNKDEFKTKFSQGKLKALENENEIGSKINDEMTKSEDNQGTNMLKSVQDGIKSKLIENEETSTFNQEERKSKIIQSDTKSKNKDISGEISDPSDKKVFQDDIYDFPPSPKPHNEFYDVLPSPKPHNELYDIPPSPRADNELYECPPLSRVRNIIVSDDDATGYLFPITNSDEAMSDNHQYTNAKTLPDRDFI